jgi:cytochrome c-type biogenesis protein CcmH/NrfF
MPTMVWINVLLAVPFIALWAGIPLWLVLKRRDTRPQPTAATPATQETPATRVHAAYRRAA